MHILHLSNKMRAIKSSSLFEGNRADSIPLETLLKHGQDGVRTPTKGKDPVYVFGYMLTLSK